MPTSFDIFRYTEKDFFELPKWNFTPNYEIIFVSNGEGKRHIGGHVSHYQSGDLIVLGPNLPHFGFTNEKAEKYTQIVLQINEAYLDETFLQKKEMLEIGTLFARAKRGIVYNGRTKTEVGQNLIAMSQMTGFDRFIALLENLHLLATSREYEILNAGSVLEMETKDYNRIQLIYNYVHSHFKENISLEFIAAKIKMTVPAFCRYFKKMTRLTFTQFVNQFRVAYACQLLVNNTLSIAEICTQSGFQNTSHFNKQFKLNVGVSPHKYRKNRRF